MDRRSSVGPAVALAAFLAAAGGLATTTLNGAQAPAARPQQPPQPPQPPQPSFRSGTDAVSLSVTVTDSTLGTPRYVTDLQQPDFEVFEDGVKQDISVFNNSNSPIALAFLIDSSASMEAKMRTAQDAATGFIRKLRTGDLAEVIDFDDRSVVSQDFTNDIPKLERAVRMMSAGGATAMFQALYIAMNEFKKLKRTDTLPSDTPRRQAVILLSDGNDTKGLFSFDDILDIVKRSETAVYTIGLGSDDDPTSGFKEGQFFLRQFAQQTGGKSFFPKQLSDLAAVYGEITDEMANQYTIGYSSKNARRDGAWRRIVVRVNRPNTAARTKLGYFAAKG